jgi:5-methylcytosine-specific restriction endonuclease McrA
MGKKIHKISKACIVCKKEFETFQGNNRYCSMKCKEANRNENKEQSYFQIFKRDSFKCIYCGKSSLEDGVKLVIDHVYPQSKGGKTTLFNCVTSCNSCNSSKNRYELKRETILQIWKRNEILNKQFGDSYNELENYYKKYFNDFK